MNANLRPSLRRRLPAWAGIGLVLSGLFASTSSFVAGVSYWAALPATMTAVFLNLAIMLPLLYRGVLRHGRGGFGHALIRTAPLVLLAQIPAGMVNTWLIDSLFSYMMLMNWWTTFAMLTGTALAISLLGLPLTIHYEQVRGELFDAGDAPRGKESESREHSGDENVGPAETPGLWIPEESGRRLVKFEDILYLTSRGHSTIIHTDRRDYKRSMLMKSLGTSLPGDAFMRVHKSHMINLKRVDRMEYLMGGAYIAFLNDEAETEVPVGRTYAAALKNTLGL